MKLCIRLGAAALLASSALVSQAQAGGLERGGYNIDLLFDPSTVTAEGNVTYVMPERKLKNATDTNTTSAAFPFNGTASGTGGGNLNSRSSSTDDTVNYTNYRAGIKAGVNGFDCLADYSQPWGAHTKPGLNWAGANENIETKLTSNNYALTCSYKFDVGPGQLRVIGGGFYQEVEGFKTRLVQDFTGVPAAFGGGRSGVGRLDLEADGWGWRTGLAYEIPEYALRASLVYNSRVKLDDITGTLNLSQVVGQTFNVRGSAEMPDSLELKLQSGIAPDWLAFGSVKWTNWSVLQQVNFANTATGTNLTSLDLGYRDGWTVMGGVGHKFNDQWSAAGSLTWDRGVSQGFGAQTDTVAFGAGVAYSPTKNVEMRLSGLIGVLTSGKSQQTVVNGNLLGNGVSYSFDNDIVTAVSANLKVKF